MLAGAAFGPPPDVLVRARSSYLARPPARLRFELGHIVPMTPPMHAVQVRCSELMCGLATSLGGGGVRGPSSSFSSRCARYQAKLHKRGPNDFRGVARAATVG